MGRLDNKVAVITGAASGIGLASALRFVHEGALVVIGDVDTSGGEAAARRCRDAAGCAVFQRCDVAVEADLKSLVDRAREEFGRLDIMFNNAGLSGAFGMIEEITVENWDRTMAALVRGVFLGMKHSVPLIRQAGGGSIISTASVAGLRGGAAPHAYSAAKAAVINLTRSVALEVAQHNIRVNCVCPGGINTPLVYNRVAGGKEVADKMLARLQPIKRTGQPEDIANMALFLASDEAGWITGAAMVVDGGYMAGAAPFGQPRLVLSSPGAFAGPSFEK